MSRHPVAPVVALLLGLMAAVCAEARAQDLDGDYWTNLQAIPAAPGVPAGAPTLANQATPVIDFSDGNNNAPAAPLLPFPTAAPHDLFIARYSGFIQGPITGTVTFETESDDGVELRVDNQAVIANWTNHSPTINTGTFNMVQGLWYPIQLLFYENTGGGRIRLRWQYQGQALQYPPATHISQSPPAPPAPVIVSSQAGDLQSTFNNFQWTYAGVGTAFNIYANGSPTPLATVPITQFSYTDMAANQYNVQTCYTVTAVNGSESVPSNQACLTPLPPPPRTNDHDEGLFEDKCACGSSVPASGGAALALAALLLAAAAVLGRR